MAILDWSEPKHLSNKPSIVRDKEYYQARHILKLTIEFSYQQYDQGSLNNVPRVSSNH
jgi:hypothetical protein